MIEAELPPDEAERLAALHRYRVLDTEAERCFDDLTQLASHICGTPIALVSLVDGDRQWFKSKVGLDACQTPRKVAFCSHAILQPDEVMHISDSLQDPRFHDNPIATGEPHVRFYASAPLVTPEGHAVGTLCVIDNVPRELDQNQRETLRMLSRQVVSQLELRRNNRELYLASTELGRLNGELEQFASVAAHDLQEPLRKLVSFSELLEEDLGSSLTEEAGQDLYYIKDSARRMQGLVSDLLRLSQAGSGPLKLEEVSLQECVHQALEALSLRIEETQADVSMDPLPFVQGDATLLVQLFQNLIGNALKFVGDRKPNIRVTCIHDGERTVLGVRDNGIGMEPDYAERIFAPFERLHGRSEYEGTGIGLAISRKVVERHGGEIWVDAALGKGCHFRFVLDSARLAAAKTAA